MIQTKNYVDSNVGASGNHKAFWSTFMRQIREVELESHRQAGGDRQSPLLDDPPQRDGQVVLRAMNPRNDVGVCFC
jgi:hypothetical protein